MEAIHHIAMKPITVTIKETRHKSQPWIFDIDMPGPAQKQTKRERYVNAWSAYRGAIRQLNLDWCGAQRPYHKLVRGHLRRVVRLVVPLKKKR